MNLLYFLENKDHGHNIYPAICYFRFEIVLIIFTLW